MTIDITARVSGKARIAENVSIGPYTVIEDDVEIGPGTAISANAYICAGTTIGSGCNIHMGACLGDEPQDLAYKGEKSYLKIGDNNTFREHVTVHRGTANDSYTIIGDNNYFMCLSHVAHNCNIASNVIICNNALLGGYVEVEDRAFISGGCLIHQFVRVGTLAMLGGGVRINKDFPPFMSTTKDNTVESYNIIGIRRAGVSIQVRKEIKEVFRLLYCSGLNQSQALSEIEKSVTSQEVLYLIDFIRASKRGVCARHSNRDTSSVYESS